MGCTVDSHMYMFKPILPHNAHNLQFPLDSARLEKVFAALKFVPVSRNKEHEA